MRFFSVLIIISFCVVANIHLSFAEKIFQDNNLSKYTGTYIFSHEIPIINHGISIRGILIDRRKWKYVEVEDCISIDPINNKQLRFSFISVGTNGHYCNVMEEMAKQQGDIYEYIGKQSPEDKSDCIIRIQFLRDKILLQEINESCKNFCGVRARIGNNVFLLKDKVENKECSF